MPDTLSQPRDIRKLLNRFDGAAIWVVSKMGEFSYISDGFEDIWGIPASDVREEPERLIETIHPDDRARVQAEIQQSAVEVTETEYVARIVRDDGGTRTLKTQQVPIRDSEGNLKYVVGISTDITEQKRREQELEILNRIVRHDIRNDMSVLLGWAELLEAHVDEDGSAYLENVLASGGHIIELTETAREYVEAIVSDEDLTVEPVSLRGALQTELSLREESFPAADFVCAQPLPEVEVLANEMLTSVFRNLLNNAVQHNDKPTPVVDVSCTVQNDHVDVQIADNGPGIPDAQKESIFGKAEKGLDSQGTGVGLYLVNALIEKYGGSVWVEDNQPTGTRVVVRLLRAK